MKNSIVCCFLTHDHVDILKDILDRALPVYGKYGIDICVFDDSERNDTKALIDDYIDRGIQTIYYADMHGVNSGDEKLLRLLQGSSLPKMYDYIWPCKDRLCFSDAFLDRLSSVLEQGYDVVQIIQREDRMLIDKSVYTDPVDFYGDFAYYTTNWEGTIRKTKTMLTPIRWDEFLEQYGCFESFYHTLSLFHQLAETENVKIALCDYVPAERYMSLNSGASGWRKREAIYSLWIDQWVRANYSLPSAYDAAKARAIKGETNLMELFGSLEWMMNYHEEGLYDWEIYNKYESMWPYLTDLPLKWLELAARGEYREVISLAVLSFKEAFEKQDYLWAFRLFSTNTWFDRVYHDKEYQILNKCFVRYREDLIENGYSNVFNGITSVEKVLDKYCGSL